MDNKRYWILANQNYDLFLQGFDECQEPIFTDCRSEAMRFDSEQEAHWACEDFNYLCSNEVIED